MNFLIIFLSIFLSIIGFAHEECNFKTLYVENKNYNDILRYALKIKMHGCIPSVLEQSKKHSQIAQVDALRSALVRYRCVEGCSAAEENEEQELFKSACKKGFLDICLEIDLEDNSITQEKKLLNARKYCESKSSNSCYYVGLQLQQTAPEESIRFKKLACELNSKAACKYLKVMEEFKQTGVQKK